MANRTLVVVVAPITTNTLSVAAITMMRILSQRSCVALASEVSRRLFRTAAEVSNQSPTLNAPSVQLVRTATRPTVNRAAAARRTPSSLRLARSLKTTANRVQKGLSAFLAPPFAVRPTSSTLILARSMRPSASPSRSTCLSPARPS